MNLEHIGTSTYNDLITIFKLHLLYSLCGFLVIDNYEELMCHQLLFLKWPIFFRMSNLVFTWVGLVEMSLLEQSYNNIDLLPLKTLIPHLVLF